METNSINPGQFPLVDQVKAELQRQQEPRKSSLQNIRMLAVSLIIFGGLGLFQQSLAGVAIVVAVLFIHETGHLIGMKIFGYRDVQMFFIPFFGAAVSGVQKNASSTQQAIVALLGPVPGIVLGIACAMLFFRTANDLYAEAASSFLFINGFNLLPFHPLDGGRVLDALLFSRNAKVEVGFKFVTAMILLVIAMYLQSMLLNCFGIFALLSLRPTSAAATIAGRIKKRSNPSELSSEEIPEAQLLYLMDEVKARLRGKMKDAKALASMARDIWQRARTVPPSVKGTAGILAVYVPFAVIGLSAPFLFDAGRSILQARTEIRKVAQNDGSFRRVQLRYVQSQKVMEVPINDMGFYDGLQTEWHPFSTEKSSEGAWKDGFLNGQWKSWNREGRVQSIIEYRMGRPVRYATIKDRTLVDVPENQWPPDLKSAVQTRPSGPHSRQTDANGVLKTAVEQQN